MIEGAAQFNCALLAEQAFVPEMVQLNHDLNFLYLIARTVLPKDVLETLMYCEDFEEPSEEDLCEIELLIESKAPIALTFDPHWLSLWTNRFGDPLLDAETFRMSSSNVLMEIGNKPKTIEEVQGQYMGLLRISPEGWAEIAKIRATLTTKERDQMHMTGTLQKVIQAERLKIIAIPYYKDWGEVDSQEDLKFYNAS